MLWGLCRMEEGGIMLKTTLKIQGMMCGMCEAHIQEAIRMEMKAVASDLSILFLGVLAAALALKLL